MSPSFFPESEETQKGHMQGQRQGVYSTKEAESPEENQTIIPHVKKHYILILVYDAKATMYSVKKSKRDVTKYQLDYELNCSIYSRVKRNR
jgi:hypothetical protein